MTAHAPLLYAVLISAPSFRGKCLLLLQAYIAWPQLKVARIVFTNPTGSTVILIGSTVLATGGGNKQRHKWIQVVLIESADKLGRQLTRSRSTSLFCSACQL
jgi:hypothetical protein